MNGQGHAHPSSRTSTAATTERSTALPWTMKEFKPAGLRKYRVQASNDDQTSSAAPAQPEASNAAPLQSAAVHQRGASESSSISNDSIMNRGRPMRRGEITSMQREPTCLGSHSHAHTTSTSSALSSSSTNSAVTPPPALVEETAELPAGHRASRALQALGATDLHNLRKDAHFQAATFEALAPPDLASLYRELATLPARAATLRTDLADLRVARLEIHARMATDLAASNPPVSRDILAAHERALSDVDERVDERIRRLECCELRRALLRQKVLEHAVAVLALELPATTAAAGVGAPEATPPRSPVDDERATDGADALPAELPLTVASPRRQEIESIRVYADSGVASLLKSIEVEIGILDQQRGMI